MKKFIAIVLMSLMTLAIFSGVMAADTDVDELALTMSVSVGSNRTLLVDVSLNVPQGHSGVRSGKFTLNYTADPVESMSYKGYTPGEYFKNTDSETFMCNETNSSEKLIFGFAFSEPVKTSGKIVTFEFSCEQAGSGRFSLELEDMTGEDTVTLLDPKVSAPMNIEWDGNSTDIPVTEMPTEEPTIEPTDIPTDEPVETYIVIFYDSNGRELGRVEVKEGETCEPPEPPARKNWLFAGWDVDFSEVTEDLIVNPIYYKLGDVNLDDNVNAGDATLILRQVAGIGNPLEELPLLLADVNQNEKVDSGDATMVLRHAVGANIIDYGE